MRVYTAAQRRTLCNHSATTSGLIPRHRRLRSTICSHRPRPVSERSLSGRRRRTQAGPRAPPLSGAPNASLRWAEPPPRGARCGKHWAGGEPRAPTPPSRLRSPSMSRLWRRDAVVARPSSWPGGSKRETVGCPSTSVMADDACVRDQPNAAVNYPSKGPGLVRVQMRVRARRCPAFGNKGHCPRQQPPCGMCVLGNAVCVCWSNAGGGARCWTGP
ncbi:hypothetical protein VFPFJ_01498 [Purpureocillium lilacinum]|uniref:Uncharacterized protein n=1 Tax=Purpureocillium lilacinum TaxID=33203 RepID=A0A179I0U8_PURLI|nr:hypothetical protein VFPFJ_01498 [Purpureocillium lilacinum]OAQ95388.1 hypothetical protein VFPFJ_01498 [Purpureocillium lilacinum]